MRQLRSLGVGRIQVPASDAIRVQSSLLNHFKKQFNAVSDRDLKFWTSQKEDRLSREYFALGVAAVNRECQVNRIFILSERDFDFDRRGIQLVLEQHERFGIGWAVVIYEQLDVSVRAKDVQEAELDFALYDHDKAVSFFHDYKVAARRYSAIFSVEANSQQIQRQLQQYRRLLPYCWLVNARFRDTHQNDHFDQRTLDEIRRVKETIIRCVGKEHAADLRLEKSHTFLWEVSDLSEIGEAVKNVAHLRTFLEQSYPSAESPIDAISAAQVAKPVVEMVASQHPQTKIQVSTPPLKRDDEDSQS
jgi:hypothetical protein